MQVSAEKDAISYAGGPQLGPTGRPQQREPEPGVQRNAHAGDVLRNDGRLGGTGHAAPQLADEPKVEHDVQPRRHRQEHQRHDRVAQRPQQRRKIIIEKCCSQPRKHDAQVRPHHGVDLGRDAQEPDNAVEPGVHSKHQHRRDTRQQHKAGKDALF